jgi:hypothetical protein
VIEPVHDRRRAWLPVITTTIPNLLRERNQWVGWLAELRQGSVPDVVGFADSADLVAAARRTPAPAGVADDETPF